jgi:hypothetical protein
MRTIHDKSTKLDLTGKTFGRWTVMGLASGVHWVVRCGRCGQTHAFRDKHLRNNADDLLCMGCPSGKPAAGGARERPADS